MLSGVYALHDAFYRLKFPDSTFIKYGHSRDIMNRYTSDDSTRLPEDSHLNDIKAVIHSPSYSIGGTRILERLVHVFYAQRRVTPNREYFRWNQPGVETSEDVIEFLKSKNIMDAQIYRRLCDVPNTELDAEYKQNSAEVGLDAIKCRSFQAPIVTGIVNHFREHDKGCIFLPPGYGKTYIAGFALAKMPRVKKILVLTPQIMICDEFRKMFENLHRQNVYLASEYSKSELDLVVSKDAFTLLATYQDYCTNPDYYQSTGFDMVIYDEAHHLVTGQQYQTAMSIQSKKLFLTATPKIQHYDDESDRMLTFSMDNETVFGKPLANISLQEGIDSGVLCDYRVLIYKEELVVVEDSNEEESAQSSMVVDESNDESSTSGENKEQKIVNVLDCSNHIKMLTETYGRKKILVFYNRCDEAQEAFRVFQVENVDSFYLDGKTTLRQERIELFQSFSSTTRTSVIFNVGIVSEGVSLPCVDCILLMASKSSQIALTQIVGRALRSHPGKSDAIVCIPERAMSTFNILLESVYSESNRNYRLSVISKVLLENYNAQSKHVILQTISNSIKMFDVHRVGGTWQFMLNLCRQYESENPERLISYKVKCDGLNIGTWINHQRTAMRRTLICTRQQAGFDLTNDERERINRRGTQLTAQQMADFTSLRSVAFSNQNRWLENMARCQRFEQQNLDQVISDGTIFENVNLGNWIGMQKKAIQKTELLHKQRAGEHLTSSELERTKRITYAELTAVQIQQFNSLRTVQCRQNRWFELFKACQQFELEHPSSKIVRHIKVDNMKIGSWIASQRLSLKKTELLIKERSGYVLTDDDKRITRKECAELSPPRVEQLLTLRSIASRVQKRRRLNE